MVAVFVSVRYNSEACKRRGVLAQLVEQWPEEPRVPSSSLGDATKIIMHARVVKLVYTLP